MKNRTNHPFPTLKFTKNYRKCIFLGLLDHFVPKNTCPRYPNCIKNSPLLSKQLESCREEYGGSIMLISNKNDTKCAADVQYIECSYERETDEYYISLFDNLGSECIEIMGTNSEEVKKYLSTDMTSYLQTKDDFELEILTVNFMKRCLTFTKVGI